MATPEYNQFGMSGSGYSRKSKLSLPPFPLTDEPVTGLQLRQFLEQIQKWADSLQFGQVGFSANAGETGYTSIPVGTTVLTIDNVLSDSNSFRLVDGGEAQYWQLVPNCGGLYTISWNVEVTGVTETTNTYNYVSNLAQTHTAPANASLMTITCRGGTAAYIRDDGSAAGVVENRTGSTVVATFPTSAGTQYDVYVPQTVASYAVNSHLGRWPGGGDTTGSINSARGGAGYASVRPFGGTHANSLIVAGAPGGMGAGVNKTRKANGGVANGATGGNAATTTGDGLTAALFPGQGATQSAGGAAGTGGTAGSSGQGGAAGTRFNNTCEYGGGGGGGWYGGGGAGATVSANTIAGGGGGGSSYVSNDGFDVSYTPGTDTASVVNGQVVIETIALTAPAGTVVVELHVIRAVPRDKPSSDTDVTVCADRSAPYRGAVILPLDDGDMIYLSVYNTDSTNKYENAQTWLSAVRSGH